MTDRQMRKLDHIKHSLAINDGPEASGFADIRLVHQAISGRCLDEVVIGCEWLGKRLNLPLVINAITGGAQEVMGINRSLAEVAQAAGIAMAVGSQTAALDDHQVRETYAIVRKVNPSGVILANVSALTSAERALRAVEMVGADGLQVHLNIPQELAMREGDRDFRGLTDCLAEIVRVCPVPVIVKEVGFGLSRATAVRLAGLGVSHLDVAGQGGTNFIAIERQRGEALFGEDLLEWGIPTAVSLAAVMDLKLPLHLIASGGIRQALDMAKALALGAEMVGVAGHFLRLLLEGSPEILLEHIQKIAYQLKCILLMAGAGSWPELRQRPVVITGRTREWLEQWGVDTQALARRGEAKV